MKAAVFISTDSLWERLSEMACAEASTDYRLGWWESVGPMLISYIEEAERDKAKGE